MSSSHVKMDHKLVVQRDGQSSGLILFWKKEFAVNLRDKTDNYIDVFKWGR